eukprot:gene3659-4700_t
MIATVAGTGGSGFSGDGGPATSAKLQYNNGLTRDPFSTGDLLIADTNSCRIRKVTFATGIITTYAGNGYSPVVSGDGGPATSSILGGVYQLVLDTVTETLYIGGSDGTIRAISTETGIISTYAGSGSSYQLKNDGPATSAGWFQPRGLWGDSVGNLFVLDSQNHNIRMITVGSTTVVAVAGPQDASN